jgi:hypothetical protein
MTTERTTEYNKEIGTDRFEILRISFDGVRQSAGFQRAVRTSRPEYRFNGKRVSRAAFFTLRDAAKAAS